MRKTKTLSPRPSSRDLSGPALGVRNLKTGKLYEFRPRQNAIVIGAYEGSDIRLDDPYVSGAHCIVERRDNGLRVHDYRQGKNPTLVNGCPVQQSDLPVGSVLTVGKTSLLVVGPGNLSDRHGTPSLNSVVRDAIDQYGSTRGAGKALGVPKSTIARWAIRGRGGGDLED